MGVRDYARLPLVGSPGGKLAIHSLSAFDVAESFDARFAILAASVWRICALLELAALFYFLRFDFGLVVSDFLARQPGWPGFTSRCVCVGHIICASLVERHPSPQRHA